MGEQIQITLSTATLLAILGFLIREFLKARNSKKVKEESPRANPDGAALREYLNGQFALLNQSVMNLVSHMDDGFKDVSKAIEDLKKKINASA